MFGIVGAAWNMFCNQGVWDLRVHCTDGSEGAAHSLTRANDVDEDDVVVSTTVWGRSSMIAGDKPTTDAVPKDDRHRLRFCFSTGTLQGSAWRLHESNRHYLTAGLGLMNDID